jgi:hypothetical protein
VYPQFLHATFLPWRSANWPTEIFLAAGIAGLVLLHARKERWVVTIKNGLVRHLPVQAAQKRGGCDLSPRGKQAVNLDLPRFGASVLVCAGLTFIHRPRFGFVARSTAPQPHSHFTPTAHQLHAN